MGKQRDGKGRGSREDERGVLSLPRTVARRRALAILDDPAAEKLVPSLPLQDLYYAIKEIGLADAADLVALASPEQIRGFLDLEVWERDRFVTERADPWLELL